MSMEERNIIMITMTEEHVCLSSMSQSWMTSLILNTAAFSTPGYEQEQEKMFVYVHERVSPLLYISMMFWSTLMTDISYVSVWSK